MSCQPTSQTNSLRCKSKLAARANRMIVTCNLFTSQACGVTLNYEITPCLASPVPHLGLDLAVHQARTGAPSAVHFFGYQGCNRLRHSLWNSRGAAVAIAPNASRLATVGHHWRSIFQSELRVAFLG